MNRRGEIEFPSEPDVTFQPHSAESQSLGQGRGHTGSGFEADETNE